MADDSYHRLLAEYRKRDDYDVVFRSALDDVADKLDFSAVKSCLAFGTGSGEREMEFAGRLLPNLREFVAVEPDPESAEALRASFGEGQLPGVETAVMEMSAENWSGIENPVDIVLLVSFLGHVHATDRKALFRKLMSRYLNPGGMVVIVDNICSVPSGFLLVKERLGMPRDDYDVMEEEMMGVGFRVVLTRDLKIRRDLSKPSDDVVKFIRLLADRKFGEGEVRAVIDDVFSRPNMDICMKKLAIFTK